MKKSKVSIELLELSEDKLVTLINDTYDYMGITKPSVKKFINNLDSSFKRTMKYKSEWWSAQLSKAVHGGDPRTFLFKVLLCGGGLIIANGAEFVDDAISYQKAKSRLLPYYQELASKQGALQKELITTLQEKEKCIALLQSNAEVYKKKLQELEEKQMLLTDLLTRFDALERFVTE